MFNQIRFHRIKKQLLLGILCLTIAITGLTLTQAHTAHAEDEPDEPPTPFENIIKPTGLPGPAVSIPGEDGEAVTATPEDIQAYQTKLMVEVAKRLISYAIIFCFLCLLYSGFLYLSALDSTDNYDKARRTALYSLVGLIVAMTSYGIVQLVFSIPIFD